MPKMYSERSPHFREIYQGLQFFPEREMLEREIPFRTGTISNRPRIQAFSEKSQCVSIDDVSHDVSIEEVNALVSKKERFRV